MSALLLTVSKKVMFLQKILQKKLTNKTDRLNQLFVLFLSFFLFLPSVFSEQNVVCSAENSPIPTEESQKSEMPEKTPKIKVLFTSGGHGYDVKAMDAMFKQLSDRLDITQIKMPDGIDQIKPGLQDKYDVVVFYDMYNFPISETQKKNLLKLFEEGMPLFALHHHIGAHQNWDEYFSLIGGRYFEVNSRTLKGKEYPVSTYSHDETMNIFVCKPEHPAFKGLKDFVIHDETYGNVLVDPNVEVLLTTDHPKASKEVAWTLQYKKSTVLTCLLGHDAKSYQNENFQKIFFQGIQFLANSKSND